MQTIKKTVKAIIRRLGYDISRIDQGLAFMPDGPDYQGLACTPDGPDYPSLREEYSSTLLRLGVMKAHYGSGGNLFGNGWVNIDRNPTCRDSTKIYMSANLASRHPFPSDYFCFSFAEDFLEHLTQDESIIFLSEAFRCLQTGGVLRLSFPGLKGVLRRHYRSSDYEGASVGMEEAFTRWEHKHFYCEESLSIVAWHIGFSDVQFVQYGISVHEELRSLDCRIDQQDLNIYAELTK
jgi:predicted SAM-dependent methyltransferase